MSASSGKPRSTCRRQNSRLWICLLLLPTTCLFGRSAEAKYGGGTGEPNDPYLIYTAEQMNAIGPNRSDWDKHFKLMADIDLGIFTGTEFNIIGLDAHNSFRGVFDGYGHTISNLTYKSADTDHIGLFGYVKGDAQISNLGLIDPNIDAGTGQYVGALVGRLMSGSVVACCCVRGGRVCGEQSVGGLLGYNLGDIRNCYSSTDVSGIWRIGGLVGRHLGRIVKSYSTSVVTGSSPVGGLVGSVCDEWDCYSPTVTSFWDVETSGQDISAAGTPKTTGQMQGRNTYVVWGCEPVWTLDEGNDYPRLLWENAPGQLITYPCYGGGSGTGEDPHLIYTAEQLHTISAHEGHWDKHFKLMADIDLAGSHFNGIGNDSNMFRGVFDGNGHTISNLTGRSGLFGCVSGAEAKLINLRLADPKLDRAGGALVESLWEATVSHCSVDRCEIRYNPPMVRYHTYRGGLVGDNYRGTIHRCHVSGWVSGRGAGGLVGNNEGTILECSSSVEVTTDDWAGGGLVGTNSGGIGRSFATGAVSGEGTIGGLVGTNRGVIADCYCSVRTQWGYAAGGLVGENMGIVTNCYATGLVEYGAYGAGLLATSSAGGQVTASFWDIQTSSRDSMCGPYGSGCDDRYGKTTAEMQMASIFIDDGWDFNDVWDICEGTNYPRLLWQKRNADIICPYGVTASDFALLASRWLSADCGPVNTYCDGTDLDQSGDVGFEDANILSHNWLTGAALPVELLWDKWRFDLQAHWKLDEAEDAIAHDSAGDNDAVLFGEPVWWPAGGRIDGGLELDGIDDFLMTGFVLNPAEDRFKVSVWLKGGGPGQVIMSQQDGAGSWTPWLWLSAEDGTLDGSVAGSREEPLHNDAVIIDGEWHEVSFIWSGAARYLCVDGVEVAADRHVIYYVEPTSGAVCIGTGRRREPGDFWSGLLDDIRIYKLWTE